MLKINGSVMDNHPHPPLFCTAVADRLVQLTLVLARPVGHMVLSEKWQSCSLTRAHTQTRAYITVIPSHGHSKTQGMWTRRSIRLWYVEIKRVKCSIWRRHTLWKQPSLKCISSCCFPHHLHYPPLCCRSVALLLAYPHFVAIIHYGLAFWHACKLANYRMASCH